MNCIVKDCTEEAEWLTLCQEHWEEYTSSEYWKAAGGEKAQTIEEFAERIDCG